MSAWSRASRSVVSQVYVDSFFGVFSVMLAHVGALGSHLAPKMSQDRVKMSQDRAKMSPDGST